MKKLLVITAILLISVAPAMASNFYGKGTLGVLSPSESGLDNTFSLYAAAGTNLNAQLNIPLSAEVGIGYTSPSDRYIDFTVIPVTVTALYELPIRISQVPPLTMNVGGGLGLYFWDEGKYNDDGVELGIHVQTGAEYKLNNQISLVAEVKLTVAEASGADIGGLSANAGAKINF